VFGVFSWRARSVTTGEPATFPKGMRVTGWVLASLMILYPVDAVLTARAFRQLRAAERVVHRPSVPTSGMQFDLRTPATHCGPLGWAGAWGFMLGTIWAIVAGGLWLYYRINGRGLTASSRRTFYVVACLVAAVLGVVVMEPRLYGP
jgi:hypothetical protein